MKSHLIIKLLMLACVLATLPSCSKAHAGWFGWGEAERLRQEREEDQRQRLAAAEQQITVHRQSSDTWEFAAGTAAVAALVLLIVGTALGTRTRHAAARPQS